MISTERKKEEWVEFCIFSAKAQYNNGEDREGLTGVLPRSRRVKPYP